ncbi:hypothetical protein ACLKA7_009136 [Drosophila subpalustris]
MNYLIQRGKVRQQAISVPDGLPELLSDITREVLRCQPTKECLCQFIIDYLHSVIVTREKAMVARGILDRALRTVDSIISDMCICDLTKEKSDMMGQVMEECFRNFLEKRRCEMRSGKEAVKFADIDMLEELIQKCGFTEDELDMSRPTIESAYKRFVDAYMAAAKDTQGTEILYQYFRDRELKRIQEMMEHQSATIIQAAWRGYVVRRTMAQHVCICTCMLDDRDREEEARIQDAAARVIQRFFKAMLLRQSIKPMGDPCAEKETPSSKDGGSIPTIATIPVTETPAGTAVDTENGSETRSLKPDEGKEGEESPALPADEASVTAAESQEPPAEGEAPKGDEASVAPAPSQAETATEQPPPAEEPAPPPADEAAASPPVEEAAAPAEEAPPLED